MNPISKLSIRAKKLGVLIRDARITAGRSIPDCAAAMGRIAQPPWAWV